MRTTVFEEGRGENRGGVGVNLLVASGLVSGVQLFTVFQLIAVVTSCLLGSNQKNKIQHFVIYHSTSKMITKFRKLSVFQLWVPWPSG